MVLYRGEKSNISRNIFLPLHKGHIDIVKKASKLFDFVYVVVSNNLEKINEIDIQKRYELVLKKLPKFSNVKIIMNKNLLTAQLAQKKGCNYLIRSGRNNIDFSYEIELAAINNKLNKNLETILIIPTYENVNYESRMMKQINSDSQKNTQK